VNLDEIESKRSDPREYFNKKNLCHRCLTGIDNNHDGDCMLCHKIGDEEAAKMRRAILLFTLAGIEEKQ
jgi:hypothetical protein